MHLQVGHLASKVESEPLLKYSARSPGPEAGGPMRQAVGSPEAMGPVVVRCCLRHSLADSALGSHRKLRLH